MRRSCTIMFVSLLMTLGLSRGPGAANSEPAGQNGSERWTVWDGIYTDAEAENGWSTYAAACSRCHGDVLEGRNGPALTGDHFLESWREDTLENLFAVIKTMPPRGPSLDDRSSPRRPGVYPAGERLSSRRLSSEHQHPRNGLDRRNEWSRTRT